MKNLISIVSIFLLISCNSSDGSPKNLAELQSQKEELKTKIDSLSAELNKVEAAISKLDTTKKLITVTAIKPQIEDFNHYIKVQGIVKADKTVELHPEMGGTVQRILVNEGDRVYKGQTLAQMDASVLQNNIAQMQTQLELAKTTFERQERLWNQNIGSELQYLQAKAQKEGLENNIASLKAQARKMMIIAPFSGVIDEIFIKQGELASPQMPTMRLVNLKKVYLESEVTESYLKDIKKGTEVIISFPSIGKEITSKISQVGNFINPNNRSFKTRVDIPNSDETIKANLLADVRINDFSAKGIVLPNNVIQEDRNGNSFVYVINNDEGHNKVEKQLVTIGKEYNNESYISDGLSEDDLVIDKGSRLVKTDDRVQLLDN